MKAWHALYNSHVAFLQRQSEYELCFQKIDKFTATARSRETKHWNAWDNLSFICLPLHNNQADANFNLQWHLYTICTTLYSCDTYTFDSLIILPLTCFLQGRGKNTSLLKMGREKNIQFHFLLPPLSLIPFLWSLILTTSSCHPQLSPQFHLSPPNPLQRRIWWVWSKCQSCSLGLCVAHPQ